jgi:hypothetical protein
LFFDGYGILGIGGMLLSGLFPDSQITGCAEGEMSLLGKEPLFSVFGSFRCNPTVLLGIK